MPGKYRNIFSTVRQGRNPNRNDVKPVEQVFSKRTLRNHCFKVLVCGRDNPDVDFDFLAASYPAYPLFLDCPEDFGLQRRRQVPDFIQKQRSVGCKLK